MKLHLAVLAMASIAMALPVLEPRQSIQDVTDELLFTDSIDQFEAARNARDPSSLDWSSDNCSDSPDNPFGFNRHDFGYRNYKKQSRFTAANKARIDSNFKQDLDNQCNKESSAFKRGACTDIAEVYYEAVKNFGHKKREAELEARGF